MDRPENRRALIELAEPLDRHHQQRALRSVDVWHWPLTIGRALDNDLVLDDPHVAPHHARLSTDEAGRVVLTVLTSSNGVQLGKRRLASGESLSLPEAGASVAIGSTRLRIRLPSEVLAPEQPLPGPVTGWRGHPLLAAVLLLALAYGNHWVQLDPGADLSTWLPLVIGFPLAVILWVGCWALVSKLFAHRFDFGGHLRIALPWLLLIMAVDLFWPSAAAALDWPLMWKLSGFVQALLAALLVRAHLVHALPAHRRTVSVAVAAMLVASLGVSMVLTWRQMDSVFAAPYMSSLPLPALRVGHTGTVGDLMAAMTPLQDRLKARVQKARDEDEADSADADDGE
ncbi:MAG: FHA domain-containing protein [Pseudomonadota bacterium]|nr:FHA domain-containing protein [Pseudomonadota bacterium]